MAGLEIDEIKENLEDLSEYDIQSILDELDPMDEMEPPSSRMPNQTNKVGSHHFDNEQLKQFMLNSALKSTVGEDYIPYTKVNKPNTVKIMPTYPTTLSKKISNEDDEIFKLLSTLEPSEVDDIALELGIDLMNLHEGSITKPYKSVVHSKCNSDEQNRNKSNVDIWPNTFDFDTSTLHIFGEKPSYITPPSDSTKLDIEYLLNIVLLGIKNNYNELQYLNLNHIKLSSQFINKLADGLSTNTQLKVLKMSNTDLNDESIIYIANALKYNIRLSVLEVESNNLSRVGIKELFKALESNQRLKELRLDNQKKTLGIRLEMEIIQSLEKNTTIRKCGYSFQSQGPRHMMTQILMRNGEIERKKNRMSQY